MYYSGSRNNLEFQGINTLKRSNLFKTTAAMKTLSFLLLCLCCAGGLQAQPTLDTVAMPRPMERHATNERMIPFFQPYAGKSAVKLHLTTSAAPQSNGSGWRTTYAEGDLTWKDQFTLTGTMDEMYSDRKALGSVAFNPFKSETISVEIDTRNNQVRLSQGGSDTYYNTTLSNNLLYGFNNSNKIIVLTFERP